MRHIVISIILILAFLSGFSQTQQVLKNGFVAATDDGVWYLQDGFNEWVKLTIKDDGLYKNNEVDTIRTVTHNNRGLLYCISNGVSIYNDYRYRWIRLDGKNINKKCGSGGGPYPVHMKAISRFKHNKIVSWFYSFSFSSSTFAVQFDESIDNCASVGYSYGLNAIFTDMASDNDTIACIVGENNKGLKYIVTNIVGNKDTISISGLHSRSTDSHKITYNPDDDVFIIISDSGIVYSYDKTTLTTLDTVYLSGYVFDKIHDLAYNKNDQYYYMIMRRSSPDTNYSILMTDDFTSYKNIGLGSNYPPVLAVGNPYTLAVDSGVNVLIKNPSIPSYDLFPELPDRIVFDLDYINYIPD